MWRNNIYHSGIRIGGNRQRAGPGVAANYNTCKELRAREYGNRTAIGSRLV